jgi:hypothetical protein
MKTVLRINNPSGSRMRNYKWDKRELADAALYFENMACQGRLLPHNFLSFPTSVFIN